MAGPEFLELSEDVVNSARGRLQEIADNLQNTPRSEWDHTTRTFANVVDDIDYSRQTDDSGYLAPDVEQAMLDCFFAPGEDKDEDFAQDGLYTVWSLVEQFVDFWNNSHAFGQTSTIFVDEKRVVFTGAVSYGGNEFPRADLLELVFLLGVADDFNIIV